MPSAVHGARGAPDGSHGGHRQARVAAGEGLDLSRQKPGCTLETAVDKVRGRGPCLRPPLWPWTLGGSVATWDVCHWGSPRALLGRSPAGDASALALAVALTPSRSPVCAWTPRLVPVDGAWLRPAGRRHRASLTSWRPRV